MSDPEVPEFPEIDLNKYNEVFKEDPDEDQKIDQILLILHSIKKIKQ